MSNFTEDMCCGALHRGMIMMLTLQVCNVIRKDARRIEKKRKREWRSRELLKMREGKPKM